MFFAVLSPQISSCVCSIGKSIFFSPEKTLADCFKFRNKIGLDTAVEAVRFYRERRNVKVDELMRYAAMCRVEKIIRPYLEALLFWQ